jgi:hypothetical protein
MLHTNKISTHDVGLLQDYAVIPLASYGDKMLAVSSVAEYTVHQNGKLICKTSSMREAVDSYNKIEVNKRALSAALAV